MQEQYLETKYIPFFNIRFIFRKEDGKWKYHGWYHPKLNKVV